MDDISAALSRPLAFLRREVFLISLDALVLDVDSLLESLFVGLELS